jgi:hypothetical protein
MAKTRSAEKMTEEKLRQLYWWWDDKWKPEWQHSWGPGWQEIGVKVGFPEGSAGFYALLEFQHCAYRYEALARKKRGSEKRRPPKWPNGKPFHELSKDELFSWNHQFGGNTWFDKMQIVTIPDVLEGAGPDSIVLPLKIRPHLASKNYVLQHIADFLEHLMRKKGLRWGRNRKVGRGRTGKLAWKTLEDADRMSYGLQCLSGNTEPEQAVRRLLRNIPDELPILNASSRDNKLGED